MEIEVNEIEPAKPEGFILRLRLFDHDLFLEWEKRLKYWMILRKDPYTGEIQHVMNVVDENGNRRSLEDGWVFRILERNSYYSRNPDELEKIIVDPIEDRERKNQIAVDRSIQAMINDPVMKSRFNHLRNVVSSVDPSEWKRPKHVRGNDGKLLYNHKGKPIMYVPHKTLME